MFVTVPAEPGSAVATISIENSSPGFIVPILQFGAVHVPVEGVALTRLNPDGNTSVITRLVTGLTLQLLIVIVNVTSSPSAIGSTSSTLVI